MTMSNADLINLAHELGAEPCGDPRCENGTIIGDEYVTRDGDVDNYTWDCSQCNPTPSIYTWDDMTEVPF
jgi:hypothetical protein